MDNTFLFADEKERPLEHLVPDGGYSAIFRRVCCIGDSLSSGEFEVISEDGVTSYHDIYEQSWGQYLARKTGAKVYNFSRGGLTAKEFLEDYAVAFDCYNPEKACQAYILALGVNDLINRREAEIGTKSDFAENAQRDTFARYMGKIVRNFQKISPDAKFFFLTIPRDTEIGWAVQRQDAHAALMYDMAEYFANSYVIDLRKYAPVYDEKFKEVFYLHGHLSPMGYKLTADLVASYIDYIVRHRYADFKNAGMIGK